MYVWFYKIMRTTHEIFYPAKAITPPLHHPNISKKKIQNKCANYMQPNINYVKWLQKNMSTNKHDYESWLTIPFLNL
jgi:hypothetical protein